MFTILLLKILVLTRIVITFNLPVKETQIFVTLLLIFLH